MEKEKIIKSGKIASRVKEYAKEIIKTEMPLLEIAEKIENKISELGGKPAFPVNLSINEIAAHYTPSYDDKNLAQGILKVDFGVHIDGWTADTAFSVDLENSEENKRLIRASEKALNEAIKKIKINVKVSEIGRAIQNAIESYGFSPVANLSGHEMKQYKLHAGKTIPNIDTKGSDEIKDGIYAIEPFATTGNGKVREGKPSGIYFLVSKKNPRSQTARNILEFIKEEYGTLPFCSRWIVKKFGVESLFALSQLEGNGNLHQYPQLVEISKSKVSQAEDTIFIQNDKIFVTTD